MKRTATSLDGLFAVTLDAHADARGGLLRIFDAVEWAGFAPGSWNQVVTSTTRAANTLRGMHYQRPPHAEAKLVVPQSGVMFWASVDARPRSATFGQWHGATLDAANGQALLAAPGFAHGCLSLSDDVSLLILSTETHRPEGGAGFRWDDPAVGIAWPDLGGAPFLSDVHGALPSFSQFAKSLGVPALQKETVDA